MVHVVEEFASVLFLFCDLFNGRFHSAAGRRWGGVGGVGRPRRDTVQPVYAARARTVSLVVFVARQYDCK